MVHVHVLHVRHAGGDPGARRTDRLAQQKVQEVLQLQLQLVWLLMQRLLQQLQLVLVRLSQLVVLVFVRLPELFQLLVRELFQLLLVLNNTHSTTPSPPSNEPPPSDKPSNPLHVLPDSRTFRVRSM